MFVQKTDMGADDRDIRSRIIDFYVIFVFAVYAVMIMFHKTKLNFVSVFCANTAAVLQDVFVGGFRVMAHPDQKRTFGIFEKQIETLNAPEIFFFDGFITFFHRHACRKIVKIGIMSSFVPVIVAFVIIKHVGPFGKRFQIFQIDKIVQVVADKFCAIFPLGVGYPVKRAGIFAQSVPEQVRSAAAVASDGKMQSYSFFFIVISL